MSNKTILLNKTGLNLSYLSPPKDKSESLYHLNFRKDLSLIPTIFINNLNISNFGNLSLNIKGDYSYFNTDYKEIIKYCKSNNIWSKDGLTLLKKEITSSDFTGIKNTVKFMKEYINSKDLTAFNTRYIYTNYYWTNYNLKSQGNLLSSEVNNRNTTDFFLSTRIQRCYGFRTKVGFITSFLSLVTENYEPIFLSCIKEEDIEYYKLCLVLNEPFPIDKLTILVDSVNLKEYINTRSNFGTYIMYLIECMKEYGLNVEYNNKIIQEFVIANSIPKFKSIVESKNFSKVISEVFIKSIRENTAFKLEDKYKPIQSEAPSKRIVSIYNDFITNKKVRTMVTYDLHKSKLAELIGLGQTPEQIAAKLNVEVSDIKDALVQLGLLKSRKKAKPYIINLVEDI